MVVEILEVPESRRGAAGVDVDRGGAMGGEGESARLAQRRGFQEAGDPAAAGGVGLEDVHGVRFEHPAEVAGVVAVLSRGDLHAGGRAVAQEAQAFQIVGGDRLLEPGNAAALKSVRRTRAPPLRG